MEKFTKKPNFLTKYEVMISDYLKSSVLSYDGDISKYINNYFGWEDNNKESSYQGKAFRPALCIALCDSLSGNISAALPCSISVELVHNFSLIHDDIEDNDKLRKLNSPKNKNEHICSNLMRSYPYSRATLYSNQYKK